ncbi:MAG: malonyl-ACP O-methyltransferase BioC [Porticoccus sp.]|nr:malonyl-ACP O-methyltransferase BioC [Porticoccus sp.]MBQ0806889.1 malonyl-ACP O-methyltransferase BioC [Porticoccus sp.]
MIATAANKVLPSPLAVYDYPCQGNKIQPEPLVLLHGWGSDSRIWQTLLPELTQHLHVMAIDLPGFGQSLPLGQDVPLDKQGIEHYLDAIGAVLPARCTLLGWSLGGMLATMLTSRYPERFNSLITIASNGCFVQQPNWSCAMPAQTFDAFFELFQQQPALCLKRFHGLQCRGDKMERPLLKTLRETFNHVPEAPDDSCWRRGLELLSEIDNRKALQSLKVRGLHIYGDTDQLVPVAAACDIKALNHSQQVEILENTAHVPQLSCPEQLASKICAFLREGRYHLDKQRVADSFSRAASSYDSVARLQRQVGQRLIEALPDIDPSLEQLDQCDAFKIIDLGCGTGYFTEQLAKKYPFADITGIDLALGMLDFASSERDMPATWLCGDAEDIPLADNSVDLIFSNLAFQWCEQLPVLASEIVRVLKPGGVIAFTSLGQKTLFELRESWAAVDDYVHVNRFLEANHWQDVFTKAGMVFQNFETDTCLLPYRDLRHLTSELKGLGAHNVNVGQNRGLTGREHIRKLVSVYEKYRNPQGELPATWEVIYGVAHCNV